MTIIEINNIKEMVSRGERPVLTESEQRTLIRHFTQNVSDEKLLNVVQYIFNRRIGEMYDKYRSYIRRYYDVTLPCATEEEKAEIPQLEHNIHWMIELIDEEKRVRKITVPYSYTKEEK